MPKKRKQDRKELDRYDKLKRSILPLGYIRRGSLVPRFMPCGKPGCHCLARSPKLHGPYNQWTRKIRGKTVTVRLTQNQARRLSEWIANSRRFDSILAQMESVSMRITEQILQQEKLASKKHR